MVYYLLSMVKYRIVDWNIPYESPLDNRYKFLDSGEFVRRNTGWFFDENIPDGQMPLEEFQVRKGKCSQGAAHCRSLGRE